MGTPIELLKDGAALIFNSFYERRKRRVDVELNCKLRLKVVVLDVAKHRSQPAVLHCAFQLHAV